MDKFKAGMLKGLEVCSGGKFYHVFTKGLEDDVIFRNRDDYVVGMNYVPVALAISKVAMIAFVLMSNHFHFIIYGDYDGAVRFIDMYKRLVSRYVRNKYGVKKILRAVKTTCSEINCEDEGLKRLIAYALNNPVKAGVNYLPQNYEWGSGKCYFSNMDHMLDTRPISDLSVRERCRVLKSEVEVDGAYRINSHGYIEPGSYVKVEFVESLFRFSRSMEYFLNISSRVDSRKDDRVVYSDTLVMLGLQELLEKKYESLTFADLSFENKRMVLSEVRKQFNCPPKQLARVLGISLKDVVNCVERNDPWH